MSEPPPDFSGATFDFSEFHPTGDHWPFSAYCRSFHGGGRLHLRYAWDFRRRDQVLRPWRRLRCRLGRHEPVETWHRDDPAAPWWSVTVCRDCGVDTG